MNTALQKTVQYVTGFDNLQEVNEQQLQSIINEYPYFAPAQLIYAAKLKSTDSNKLSHQLLKTGLFFNNSRWLQYQLLEANSSKFNTVTTSNNKSGILSKFKKYPSNVTVINTRQPIITEEVNQTEPEETNASELINNISIPSIEDVKQMMNGKDVIETAIAEPTIKIDEPRKAVSVFDLDIDYKEKTEDVTTENFEDITQISNYNSIADENIVTENKVEESIVTNIENENSVENFEEKISHQNSYDEVVEIPSQQNTTATNNIEDEELKNRLTKADEIHNQIEALKQTWYKTYEEEQEKYNEVIEKENIEQQAAVEKVIDKVDVKPSEEITINESTITEVIEDDEPINTEIEASINSPDFRKDWDKPAEEFANQLLPFESEPYYTIDYFASQGIKFDYTKEPQDRLTSKMLKFTDWLKKMKSGKPETNIIDENPELEKTIMNIATASNQSKEVVTETMAEIFARQGKKEQAIQLYIKLSFLIPDKTTYFAAKIKELKGI